MSRYGPIVGLATVILAAWVAPTNAQVLLNEEGLRADSLLQGLSELGVEGGPENDTPSIPSVPAELIDPSLTSMPEGFIGPHGKLIAVPGLAVRTDLAPHPTDGADIPEASSADDANLDVFGVPPVKPGAANSVEARTEPRADVLSRAIPNVALVIALVLLGGVVTVIGWQWWRG